MTIAILYQPDPVAVAVIVVEAVVAVGFGLK